MSLFNKKSKPHQTILALQKKIYQENQKKIVESADVIDRDFHRYERHYLNAVKSYQKITTVPDVIAKFEDNSVILAGDYHTLNQSQRSFMRVLRSYIQDNQVEVVVALEAVQAKYQKALDQFMKSEIDDQAFIKKIGFKKHWFFDLWTNYKVIFDFLKANKIETYAIDANAKNKKSLMDRDQFMANKIVDIAKKNLQKKIFVLVGDLHLAPKHLPKAITQIAKKNKLSLNLIKLYQNSPEIYWKLSHKGIVEHTHVVQISKTEFCRMNTPPIIAQQSYLNWLYQEDGGFDWVDAKGSFLDLIQQVAKIIDVNLPVDYDNVEVYTCGDLSFIKVLQKKKIYKARELNFIRSQILNSESYFLAPGRMVYLANVSINHAAEEASHYLKFLLSGPEFERSKQDAFYANILHEALGFFGSKLINAKRKCARHQDFVRGLQFLRAANLIRQRYTEYQSALLFINHVKLIKKGKLFGETRVSNLSSEMFMAITHAIGYDLGELLYYAFLKGMIKKEEIQKLFQNPFKEEGQTGKTYLQLIRQMKSLKRPQQF